MTIDKAKRNRKIAKDFLRGDTLEAIGARYGLTRESIRIIALKAGLEPRGYAGPNAVIPTEADVRRGYDRVQQGATLGEAAKVAGISEFYLRERLIELKLHVPTRNGHPRRRWTGDEDDTIRRHYNHDMSATEIADILGRTRNEVIGRANRISKVKEAAE